MGLFPTLNELIEDAENMRLDDDVKSDYQQSFISLRSKFAKYFVLVSLRSKFAKYFPDSARNDLLFVRDPCQRWNRSGFSRPDRQNSKSTPVDRPIDRSLTGRVDRFFYGRFMFSAQ